jgi:hypothetical protein
VQPLASSNDEGVQEATAGALQNLAHESVGNCPAIAAAGAIPALVRCLVDSRSEAVQAEAASAVGNLAFASRDIKAAIAAAGGIPALVGRLASRSEKVQHSAAIGLRIMATDNPANSAAIAKSGSIPILVRCLASRNVLLQEQSALGLAVLAIRPDNCSAIAAAGAIPAPQLLLSDSPTEDAQMYAAAALRKLLAAMQPEATGDYADSLDGAGAAPTGETAAIAAPESPDPVAGVCAADGCDTADHLKLCTG